MSSPFQLSSLFGSFGNTSGNTIWNHNSAGYSGYEVNSASEMSNTLVDSLLDPTGLVSGFWNDLTGTTSQSREFAQQEYLQDKMNEYNTPANQMARMKAAGINPNTAAAGIAQSGSESAQAPAVASNTGGAAAGLSAVGSALGGVSGAALTAAQKRNLDASSSEMKANADRTNALVGFEAEKMRADTAKTWTDNGMDASMADYWSTKAFYADQQERLDIAGKFYQVKKAKSEIKLIDEQYEIACKDLEIRKEQLSQEEYRTEQMRIQTERDKRSEEILKKYGVDISLPDYAMMVEAWDTGVAETILSSMYSTAYQKARASYDAELDTLDDKISKQIEGQFKLLEKNTDLQKELQKFGVAADAASTVIQTILKYFFGTGFSVNVRGVGVTNNEPTR